ncbi:MAG: hypothetical protein KBE22_03240 [Candidatus Accumulibacter sp.]|nr:hypothetical protein [Accumulibacter sp.]
MFHFALLQNNDWGFGCYQLWCGFGFDASRPTDSDGGISRDRNDGRLERRPFRHQKRRLILICRTDASPLTRKVFSVCGAHFLFELIGGQGANRSPSRELFEINVRLCRFNFLNLVNEIPDAHKLADSIGYVLRDFLRFRRAGKFCLATQNAVVANHRIEQHADLVISTMIEQQRVIVSGKPRQINSAGSMRQNLDSEPALVRNLGRYGEFNQTIFDGPVVNLECAGELHCGPRKGCSEDAAAGRRS